MPKKLDPITVLTEARTKIATPEQWTQKTFARNADGRSCLSPNDPNAVCYCGLGAVMAVAEYDTPLVIHDTLRYLAKKQLDDWGVELPDGRDAFVYFNDYPGTTHEDVITIFNQAIALITPTATEAPTS